MLALDLAEGYLSEGTVGRLTNLAKVLGISLITLLGAFLALMNKEYRHTFFSTESAPQMTKRIFLEGNDLERYTLFQITRTYWKSFEDKVAAWVKEGWSTWEEEKPDWFTDQWKSIVPEEMKPTKGKGDADGEDKTAAEVEGGDEALSVGGGEEQNGRRRSILEMISGQKAVSSKVMPAGGIKKEEIDAEEFVRELNRRGSMRM